MRPWLRVLFDILNLLKMATDVPLDRDDYTFPMEVRNGKLLNQFNLIKTKIRSLS